MELTPYQREPLQISGYLSLPPLSPATPSPHHATNSSQATFISLPSQDPPLQTLIDNALQHLGPLLTHALIYNIGGHAARSEIDKLSGPIKKLVVRQLNAKRWFEAALFGDNFPSDKVGEEEKRVFLQKIVKYVTFYSVGWDVGGPSWLTMTIV